MVLVTTGVDSFARALVTFSVSMCCSAHGHSASGRTLFTC